MSLEAWLLAAALMYAPPKHHVTPPGERPETYVQRVARYQSIASDIAHTVRNDKPIPGLSREQSAALLLGLAIGESGLSRDIDRGQCFVAAGSTRCDSGRSASIFQILVRRWRGEEFTTKDLADRRFATGLALQMVRSSWNACREWPPRYRLSVYGQGYCGPLDAAARRYGLFLTMLTRLGDPTGLESKNGSR